MANKFPNWDRPDLSERQLVGEENRLAARGLTPEQARADLIQIMACRGGETLAQCLRAVATATEIDPATISNFLRGRAPIYGPLIDAIYGPEPSGEVQFDELTWPDDWGPMLPDAIAAGLVDATGEPTLTAETDSAPAPVPTVAGDAADAPTGAHSAPPDAPVDLPVVAETTISAPELGSAPCAGDAATTGLSDLNSLRAPAASQDGEGTLREGSTIPAGQQGQSPVQLRDVAGEGDHSRHPPPPTNSFTRVLDDLHGMIEAAQEELNAAEEAHRAAFERVQLGRLAVDALAKAYNGVAAAHQAARELISKPPVTLPERRAA